MDLIFQTHKEEIKRISDALICMESKVRINGVDIYLRGYKFNRVRGYRAAEKIANEIIKTFYGN